jgi:hypothetical protein
MPVIRKKIAVTIEGIGSTKNFITNAVTKFAIKIIETIAWDFDAALYSSLSIIPFSAYEPETQHHN